LQIQALHFHLHHKNWGVFRYSNGNTSDVHTGSFQVGNAYWFLSNTNGSFDFGNGNVPILDQTDIFEVSTFSMQLNNGWNQIANPFEFDISWSDVLTFNSITSEIIPEYWTFNGSYSLSDNMRSNGGGFVFVNSAVLLQFPALQGTLDKNARISGRTQQKNARHSTNSLDSDDWSVNFTIRNGTIENSRAGFGMSTEANLSKDYLDRITIPRFLDYLELNFDHPEYFANKFTMDIVPTVDNFKWDFEVNSSLKEKITLSWDNSYFGSNDRELILYDLEAKRKIDMRMQSEYSFFGEMRNFELYFGDALFISESLKPQDFVSLVYPNPASSVVTFQLGFPDSQGDYRIDIKIFNSMGQIVDMINANNYSPGFHNISWNFRSNDVDIPSGLYLYKISIEGISEHKNLTGRLIIKE